MALNFDPSPAKHDLWGSFSLKRLREPHEETHANVRAASGASNVNAKDAKSTRSGRQLQIKPWPRATPGINEWAALPYMISRACMKVGLPSV